MILKINLNLSIKIMELLEKEFLKKIKNLEVLNIELLIISKVFLE